MALSPRWLLLTAVSLGFFVSSSAPAGDTATRKSCKDAEGFWVAQGESGLCLDPRKSHEFGRLNEKKSEHDYSSLEVEDYVTKKKVEVSKLLVGGKAITLCNFSDVDVHHGGPAAAAKNNSQKLVKPGDCMDVDPIDWKIRRPNKYAVTGIYTPKAVDEAYAALQARIKAEGWKTDSEGRYIPNSRNAPDVRVIREGSTKVSGTVNKVLKNPGSKTESPTSKKDTNTKPVK